MTEQGNIPKIISDSLQGKQVKGQCDCDCDCACAMYVAPASELSKNDCACAVNHATTGALSLPEPQAAFRATENLFRLGMAENYELAAPLTGKPVMLNATASCLLDSLQTPLSLDELSTRHADIDPSHVYTVLDSFVSLGLASTSPPSLVMQTKEFSPTLTAWLHVTDHCNLRCDYCYLPHHHVDMSLETGLDALEATFHSAKLHGYQTVKLKYAGGEPLLRLKTVQKLHEYAQKLADSHQCKLEGVLLSNGTLLTAADIDLLKMLNLRLMISLDGLGHFHDTQRHHARGRGTFSDVQKAILLAKSEGLTPDISITISHRSADGLPALLEWVLEHDLPFILNFYRENSLSARQPGLSLEERPIISALKTSYAVIATRLPNYSLLNALLDRTDLGFAPERPCGSGRNYMVFDVNGNISKCQMLIAERITDLRSPDPIADLRADNTSIQNLPVDEKADCAGCPWKHWCAGGCPLATQRATGRFDTKSPNCSIYRALFPEVFKLEGQRLLKYAS